MDSSKPRSTPHHGVARAILFLETEVSLGRFAVGDRLPSMRQLAKLSGVSLVTMWKATRELKQRGVLSGSSGHRFVVVKQPHGALPTIPEQTDAFPETSPERTFVRTARTIEQDILRGVYRTGVDLPSHKELCRRYGVSRVVLRLALARLHRAGFLLSSKRHFAIAPLVPSSSTARIVVVGWKWEDGGLGHAQHAGEFIRVFESECMRSNLRVELVGLKGEEGDEVLPEESVAALDRIDDPQTVIGFVYLVFVRRAVNEAVINLLSRYKKPIAVLDEVGQLASSARAASHPLTRIFTMTISPVAGEVVGRYLLSLGHTRVAYLAPAHGHLWSQSRLIGLEKIYATAGYPDGVRVFASNADFRSLGLARCDLAKLRSVYQQWRSGFDPVFVRYFDVHMDQVRSAVAGSGETALWIESTLNKVLAETGITAWVASHDSAGICALDFLQRRRIAVPGRLSVVGFDDSIPAEQNAMTSYNFDVPAAASTILHSLVDSPLRGYFRDRKIVQLSGRMIPRRSTARARL